MILPLYGGKSDVEVLGLLATGADKPGYDLVRETWASLLPAAGLEKAWRRVLHDGLLPGSETAPAVPQSSAASLASTASQGIEVIFRESPYLHDGRFSNDGWLQELPDLITKLTWDNPAQISPATAASLGVADEDLIKVSLGGKDLTLPVWIVPGQAEGTVVLTLGYGRQDLGRIASGVGANVGVLRTSAAPDVAQGGSIAKAGGSSRQAPTQEHGSMEGRPLVREGSLAEYEHDPAFAKERAEVPELLSLWNEKSYEHGHQWGMTIDLNTCVGCNACVTACQSENNIPIVGKDQVRRGREMHWIRVDRYFSGPAARPELVFQPVPCMQCENAPCEQVCPVAATVHDDEGLNVMAYNRCIGTRYCSNNCPYKVRRFNFFNFTKDTPESLKLVQNPDVTVRARGVMEKCTYCTQRINAAKLDAKLAGRELKDGDVTTACEQACPAGAITFGDLRDAGSRVVKAKQDPRGYAILAELNTKPRTTYLAKVRNPHPGPGGLVKRALLAFGVLVLSGCGLMRGCTSSKPPIHVNPSMDNQPKLRAQHESKFFYDGSGMRKPVEGTVARGELHENDGEYLGKNEDGSFVAAIPVAVDDALLARGKARYAIYCQPCHDPARRREGDPLPARQRAHGVVPPGQDPQVPGRADLRRDHERLGAHALLQVADPAARPLGDRRLRASAAEGARRVDRAEGHPVKLGKLQIAVGVVLAIVGLVAALRATTYFVSKLEYKAPERAAAPQLTPRDQGVVDEHETQAKKDAAKPYAEAEYRAFPVVGSRVAIWVVAQLHLLFAAFVLAVPIFALIIEFIGYRTKDKRYDHLAYEFTKLLSVSFSLTATFGAFLTFMLIALYPKFTNYLMSVFSPTFLPYVLLFFLEAFFLYTYYYGWGKFSPRIHLLLGLGLNLVGTAIMLIANAWLTFMMSPRGVSEAGAVISVMDAVTNFTWMPINVHRVIANVAFGGSVAGRLRRREVPPGEDRRGAGALRLDGVHRELRRDQRVPAPPLRRLLAREGDLRVLPDARASR
jgi:Fe-S-cluster-containing dehydrogenase component